ncbi:ImmA/IrrE family metallo-endopeptidase [Aquabacterium sp.]|uniref:ImmA/IrrE family metallo-endopeptidase n=1 Tax=Aquabacterium sp. TaxID=1872578 RepID=UPI003D6D819C
MPKNYQWTNRSVLGFAGGADPVATMEARARALALKAMDEGWSGPPFDPLLLAQRLGLNIEAHGDIPDARLVPIDGNRLVLEYNPTRPRGRLRFSIAHEIAHTLFADCADQVRHRGGDAAAARDNWQLEVLCNIGAAELLMPSGSFTQLASQNLSIQKVMDIRKQHDVSVEACLIRLIKLARTPCAAFCASTHEDGGYKVDYVIPALGYNCPVTVGQHIPKGSAVLEANAIGFTAVGTEEWVTGQPLRVECVGLAPYSGGLAPRVVGLLIAAEGTRYQAPEIIEVDGDALLPRGTGPRLVAHVVPNTSSIWGGNGFASQLRRRFPDVWVKFKTETAARNRHLTLGEVLVGPMCEGVCVAHMVAQRGIGASSTQRLQYAALAECLAIVRQKAEELGASVHMPRIGTGHGGASWEIVKELIAEELVDKGVATTVYRWPG